MKKKNLEQLSLHLEELEREQQTNLKASKRKEVTKIRVEINEIETKKTTEKINETKSRFLKEIN